MATNLREIDITEVQQHNTRADCWLAIHGKVVDVTKFLHEHPGGEEVIMDLAGKECTEEFDDVGHSIDARDMLDDYIVGTLKGYGDVPLLADTTSTPQASGNSCMSWIKENGDLILSFGILAGGLGFLWYLRKKD